MRHVFWVLALIHGLVSNRDDALSELASAYADLDGLQSTLTDSAVYVRYLRKKVLELEMANARMASKAYAQEQRCNVPPPQHNMQEGVGSSHPSQP